MNQSQHKVAFITGAAASKWGLTGLTKSWAIELAPHNIREERSAGNLIAVPLNYYL